MSRVEAPSSQILPPGFVNETKLLNSFCKEFGGVINVESRQFNERSYYFAQVQCKNIAGFGCDVSQRLASVKAVAEYFERRLLVDAKMNELKSFPNWRVSSNGFAVHFSQSKANKTAVREALERHLLQYSYFKWGWSGFNLLNKIEMNDEALYFLVTRATTLNHQAGLVLVTSKRFPGFCFGYICDEQVKILQSERWDHAISEAVDKIDPYILLDKNKGTRKLSNIESSILDWMMSKQKLPHFISNQSLIDLPTAIPEIIEFNLKERYAFDFPFFGAFAYGSDIIPLIMPRSLTEVERLDVVNFLSHMGLPPYIPEKNPIL